MIKEDKTRIMITVPKTLEDDLEVLCGQMGVSKSQFIAMALGEKIMAYKRAFEMTKEVLLTSPESLIKPLTDK